MRAPHGSDDREHPERPGPSTARLRQTLAVIAVAGLGFAALELRPGSSLLQGSTHAPLSDKFGLVVLIGFGWVFLIERTYRHFRGQVQHLADLSPRAERLKDAALRLLPLVGLLLPVALLLVYRAASVLHELPPVSVLRPPPKLDGPPPEPHSDSPSMGLLAFIGLIVGLVGLIVLLWFVFRQLRRPTGAAPAPKRRVRTTERELAEAVGEARRALLHGDDARTAVIACYLAMEESLAASGVEREVSDSPTDLLERAAAAGTLRGADATELTALFREARFSRHPMDQGHLARAGAALDAIAEQLAGRIAERAAAEAEAAAARAAAAGSASQSTGVHS
ncbi:DUF4129 domain-containing protein [Kitasatospora sp. NBC_01250]|uniref:DUF4129 domain-containing protein n=1 Tax=Kitasatospora sp. NBC_01250 TaxID=2903571 RepID=UPI002E35EAB4|nr:DUF4129 domain-containing protein [Kitasatospora sp. NBC_01250]